MLGPSGFNNLNLLAVVRVCNSLPQNILQLGHEGLSKQSGPRSDCSLINSLIGSVLLAIQSWFFAALLHRKGNLYNFRAIIQVSERFECYGSLFWETQFEDTCLLMSKVASGFRLWLFLSILIYSFTIMKSLTETVTCCEEENIDGKHQYAGKLRQNLLPRQIADI